MNWRCTGETAVVVVVMVACAVDQERGPIHSCNLLHSVLMFVGDLANREFSDTLDSAVKENQVCLKSIIGKIVYKKFWTKYHHHTHQKCVNIYHYTLLVGVYDDYILSKLFLRYCLAYDLFEIHLMPLENAANSVSGSNNPHTPTNINTTVEIP